MTELVASARDRALHRHAPSLGKRVAVSQRRVGELQKHDGEPPTGCCEKAATPAKRMRANARMRRAANDARAMTTTKTGEMKRRGAGTRKEFEVTGGLR